MHDPRIKSLPGYSLSRRHLLIGAGLLGTAAVARGMVPRTSYDLLGDEQLETMIPNRIGAWEFVSKSGLVIPPQDELVAVTYAQLLTRVYTSPDRLPMMLLVAQSPGQDGVLQIHRPEFCYPASGYSLSEGRVHDIAITPGHILPTRAFTASGPDRIEQLAYWTRIGRDLPTTWAEQRWSVAKANFHGEIPDAVMVRVSTLSPDAQAVGQIDEFAQQLVGAVAPKFRQVLIGSATA